MTLEAFEQRFSTAAGRAAWSDFREKNDPEAPTTASQPFLLTRTEAPFNSHPYDGAMPSIQQLVQSIDRRIRELNREIASLEDARSALISNGPAPTPTPNARAKRARRQQSARQAPRRKRTRKRRVLLAETAEQLLAQSDGLTTAALAEQAGADRDQVLARLRDLEIARRVRRSGQRRATRWHAITDEDRIRKRAAELASRTRRSKQDGD